MTKVSVVVPVYNPGAHIDECIDSLLSQSLPAGEYEAIFVDDGSTDGTGERLDALAAAHPHVRVEHIPNSGWPGRPRNIGIEMARGDYVYFVDNDDWIDREALERMHDMAVRDDAEIVVGKVVGRGKFVPRGLFKEDLHAVDLHQLRLLGLLTPHKLFRRSLLDEHGIRFPEGERRLEDHVFVVHAYLHAKRISVLASYPCYHWSLRDPKGHASHQRLDPVGYFENLREVLDLVEEHTEPGEFRDRLMRHWYRTKMLARVGGSGFLKRRTEYNRALHSEIRKLALERFPLETRDGLPLHLRVRSHLLREGSYDALTALAEYETGLRARARLTGLRGDGTWLKVAVRAQVTGGELLFRRDGDRLLWLPPDPLRHELPERVLEAGPSLDDAHVQFLLVSPESDVEWPLETRTELRLRKVEDAPEGTVRPVLRASAVIAPTIAAAGDPLPAGDWRLRALVVVAGFYHVCPVRRDKRAVTIASRPPARVEADVPQPSPQPRGRLAQRVRRLRSLVR